LINKKGDRLNSYNVWDYAEGHDSYYRSMMVDLTQPPDKVSDLLLFVLLVLNVLETDTNRRLKSENNRSHPCHTD